MHAPPEPPAPGAESAPASAAGAAGALSVPGPPVTIAAATVAASATTVAVTTTAALETLIVRAGRYARGSRAKSTRRAYATDWRSFVFFCEAHGLTPLPAQPATLATWLAELGGEGAEQTRPYAVATIARRIASIREAHRAAGHESVR